MKEFAVNYSFENVISSPKYPQSNTEAVHAIQTVQICLKNSETVIMHCWPTETYLWEMPRALTSYSWAVAWTPHTGSLYFQGGCSQLCQTCNHCSTRKGHKDECMPSLSIGGTEQGTLQSYDQRPSLELWCKSTRHSDDPYTTAHCSKWDTEEKSLPSGSCTTGTKASGWELAGTPTKTGVFCKVRVWDSAKTSEHIWHQENKVTQKNSKAAGTYTIKA